MPLRSIADPRVFRCFFLALASISAACTIGCGSGSGSSSSTAKTSGIATADLDAHITVSAHEPGEVVVTASLEHDTGLDIEPVALSGDDSFRATAPDGDTRELARAGSSGSPRYRADFETSPAEGLVDVRFRGSHSTVRLRPEFTVTSPTRGEVFGFQRPAARAAGASSFRSPTPVTTPTTWVCFPRRRTPPSIRRRIARSKWNSCARRRPSLLRRSRSAARCSRPRPGRSRI